MIFPYLTTFIIIIILSYYGYEIGKKLQILDKPSKYKIHKFQVPLLGGLLIYLSILIFSIFLISSYNLNYNIFFFISFFFILGFIDDRINLNSNYKISFVILFSLLFIYFDKSFIIERIYFEISNNEYYFGKLKIPVTIFCILLLYIAMNMADGINCLLISFSIISLLVINFIIFDFLLDELDSAILFSLTVLLFFNYYNKIFLGNSGASLLSAYFIYKLINGNYIAQPDVFEVISIFLIMGVDMVRLVIVRLVNDRNPFDRDLNHLHHLLLKKMRLTFTVICYLFLSFFPIFLSQIFDISVLFFIPITLSIYFLLIYKLK